MDITSKEKYVFQYKNEVSDEVYSTTIYAYNLLHAEKLFKNKYKNCLYISVKPNNCNACFKESKSKVRIIIF